MPPDDDDLFEKVLIALVLLVMIGTVISYMWFLTNVLTNIGKGC